MSEIENTTSLSFKNAIDFNPLTASRDIVLAEAVNLLKQEKNDCSLPNFSAGKSLEKIKKEKHAQSCLLIVENKRLIGLLTEQDFVKFAFLGLDFKKVKVDEVMTTNLITLSESDYLAIFNILQLFRQHKIRHLPVLDREQRLLGLISQESITELVQPGDLLKLRQIKDVIDREITYVLPNTSILDVIQLMVETKSSYVLIVKKERSNNLNPLGIITERDIIQFQALEINFRTTKAETVMSYPLFSIDINSSLWEAHQEMEKRGIRRLVVSGSYGELVGVITETNLTEAIEPVELLTTIGILQKEVEKRTEKLVKLADREKVIGTIAKQINQSVDLDEILHIIVTEVRRIIGVDRTLIYSFNVNSRGIISAESVVNDRLSIFGETIENLECEGDWPINYQQGRVKAIEDTRNVSKSDYSYQETIQKYQIVASLVVPILLKVEDKKNKSVEKNLWGILILHQCHNAYQWQIEQAEFLQKLASHLALAIQHFQLVNLLQKELNDREEYELSLRQAKDNLEIEVNERTLQLQEINEQLQREIRQKEFTEQSLKNINLQLASKIEQLEQRQKERILLSNTIDLLQVCLNLEEAYQAIATLVQPLFSKTSGAVFKIDNYDDRVELVASWGQDLKMTKSFPLEDCWALRRSRYHWVQDIQIGLTCHHVDDDSCRKETLCLPMMAQGEAIGLLYFNAKPGTLTESQRKLASAIAEQTALAIANLKLRESIKYDSIRDSLTSLFNRSYTEEFLQNEIARAERKEYKIGIVLIDIDLLEKYNDIFGRGACNTILQEISLYIRQNIRTYDVAGRYNNRKIILVLPETDLENTIERAKQLKKEIENLNIKYHNRSLSHISLSIGIASFPEHGVNPQILIKVAEEALERAKIQESDRVETA